MCICIKEERDEQICKKEQKRKEKENERQIAIN